MILVDTSVWVDHLRNTEQLLVDVLGAGKVIMHSLVIGELACGNLNRRADRLRDWHALPAIQELPNKDVLNLIETKALMGRGIGLVDAHLVGSVLNHSTARLWTRDQRLKAIASELGIAFSE